MLSMPLVRQILYLTTVPLGCASRICAAVYGNGALAEGNASAGDPPDQPGSGPAQATARHATTMALSFLSPSRNVASVCVWAFSQIPGYPGPTAGNRTMCPHFSQFPRSFESRADTLARDMDASAFVKRHQAGLWRYLRPAGCDPALADELPAGQRRRSAVSGQTSAHGQRVRLGSQRC